MIAKCAFTRHDLLWSIVCARKTANTISNACNYKETHQRVVRQSHRSISEDRQENRFQNVRNKSRIVPLTFLTSQKPTRKFTPIMMRIANNKLRLLLLLLFPTLLWGNSAPMFHIRQNTKGCFVEIPKRLINRDFLLAARVMTVSSPNNKVKLYAGQRLYDPLWE